MKLFNLMDVADDSISMMLNGVKEDGTEIGFNFETNKWEDDYTFRPERIISVGAFKGRRVFHKFKKNELVTFSSIKPSTIKALSSFKTHKGIILVVKVSLVESSFNTKKAFNRRKKETGKVTYHSIPINRDEIKVFHSEFLERENSK